MIKIQDNLIGLPAEFFQWVLIPHFGSASGISHGVFLWPSTCAFPFFFFFLPSNHNIIYTNYLVDIGMNFFAEWLTVVDSFDYCVIIVNHI